MPADFLPASATDIQEPEAVHLLQQLQRQVIQISFEQGSVAIATAYIHRMSHQQPASNAASNAAPMLLLHGFDSSLLEFRRLLPFLTEREVWALDLFGFGFTEHIPNLAVTPQTIRQHLQGVVKAWIGQPIVLVGASLGGAVALDFALNHPDWVQSLVLIASVGFSGSFPLGQFLPSELLDWGAEWLHFRKWAALTAAAVLPGIEPLLVDAIRCGLLHQAMPGWKAATAAFTQSGGYGYLSQQISQVSHRTLILWGESDDVLGTADANRFEQAIGSSTLRWIPQAGHVPHFEQPQRVAELILAWE